jgi:hypothetical protein
VRDAILYHVGLGPSIIHPGMVDRVDLYPGGYPAQFGRFAGGIVGAEATAPRAVRHGEGNIRLFDLRREATESSPDEDWAEVRKRIFVVRRPAEKEIEAALRAAIN